MIRTLVIFAPAVLFAVAFSAGEARAQQGKINEALLAPVDAEQKQYIERIKAKALEFEKSLPDFSCTQMSHHSVDPKGFNQWKTLDTVSEQIRFVHHQPEYTLLAINGKKAGDHEKPPESAVPISEFLAVMHDIFDPAANTTMIWTNWDSVRGHRVHMITFAVPAEHSEFHMARLKNLKTGLAGFIYADADTDAVMRLVVAPTGVPKNAPIQSIAIDLYYDFARVGDKLVLLPLKADFRHKEGKSQIWDEVELKDFHAE